MLNAFFLFYIVYMRWSSSYFSSTSKRSLAPLISATGLMVNGRSGLWDAARPPRRPQLPGSLPRRLHSLVVQRSPSRVPPQHLPWGDSSLLLWGSYSEKPGLNSASLTLRRLQRKVCNTHTSFSTFSAGRCLHEWIAVPSQSRLFVGQFVIRFHSSQTIKSVSRKLDGSMSSNIMMKVLWHVAL